MLKPNDGLIRPLGYPKACLPARELVAVVQSLHLRVVDALREVVVYIDSAQSFADQVRVVQTQDDLLGTLLDIES